jgi:hypothetical protein
MIPAFGTWMTSAAIALSCTGTVSHITSGLPSNTSRHLNMPYSDGFQPAGRWTMPRAGGLRGTASAAPISAYECFDRVTRGSSYASASFDPAVSGSLQPLRWDVAYLPKYLEICSYLGLSDDWDGYGADRPTADAIFAAIEGLAIAQRMKLPAPEVMVGSSGDVALYWRRGDQYAELGFDQSGRFYMFARVGESVITTDDAEVRAAHGLSQNLDDNTLGDISLFLSNGSDLRVAA